MTRPRVHAFAPETAPARALAAALGVEAREIALHAFPDGEVLPTVTPTAGTAILYASLDRPNDKLIALLLTLDAFRRAGAARIVLVAPYLCYMRQDAVFAPGQPLSRDVICGLLAQRIDRLITVDAHLHRTASLADVFGATRAEDFSAAEPLADAFADVERPVIVGPDRESRPWAARIAARLNGDLIVLEKDRQGDRAVTLRAEDLGIVRRRNILLVDDICSSGATLVAAARQLAAHGALSVDVGVVHALFDGAAQDALAAAGVRRIVSTDAVRHPTNHASLAPLLARALQDEVPA